MRVRAGETVIISKKTPNSEPQDAQGRSKQKKRPVRRSQAPDEYQARRKTNDTRLYDLGYAKNDDGDFVDFDYQFITPLDSLGNPFPPIEVADYAERDNVLLDGSWKKDSFKITPDASEHHYGFTLSYGDSETLETIPLHEYEGFTEQKLKLGDDILDTNLVYLTGGSPSFGWPVFLRGGEGQQISTVVYDIAEAEAGYEYRNGDSIYFVPPLHFNATAVREGDSDNARYLNLFYHFNPRGPSLDEDHPYYSQDDELITGSLFEEPPTPELLEQWRLFSRATEIFRLIPNARALLASEADELTVAPASAFPGGEYPLHPSNPDPLPPFRSGYSGVLPPTAGILQAVITRGSTVFYIWSLPE